MCMGCTGGTHKQPTYSPKKSHGMNPFKVNMTGKKSAPSPAMATVSYGQPMIKSTVFKIGKR